MKDRSYQRSSHAVGSKSSGGRVPLQPVKTEVHSSSSSSRPTSGKGTIKIKTPK